MHQGTRLQSTLLFGKDDPDSPQDIPVGPEFVCPALTWQSYTGVPGVRASTTSEPGVLELLGLGEFTISATASVVARCFVGSVHVTLQLQMDVGEGWASVERCCAGAEVGGTSGRRHDSWGTLSRVDHVQSVPEEPMVSPKVRMVLWTAAYTNDHHAGDEHFKVQVIQNLTSIRVSRIVTGA